MSRNATSYSKASLVPVLGIAALLLFGLNFVTALTQHFGSEALIFCDAHVEHADQASVHIHPRIETAIEMDHWEVEHAEMKMEIQMRAMETARKALDARRQAMDAARADQRAAVHATRNVTVRVIR